MRIKTLIIKRLIEDIVLLSNKEKTVKEICHDVNSILEDMANAKADSEKMDESDRAKLIEKCKYSYQSILNIHKSIVKEIKEDSKMSASVILKSQLESVKNRIRDVEIQLKKLDETEDSLHADIVRSRKRSWQRISGDLETDEDGEIIKKAPNSIKTHQTNDAAVPQLWNMLLKIHDKRGKLLETESKLRAEERSLFIALQNIEGEDFPTHTQFALEESDPQKAYQLAEARYRAEIQMVSDNSELIASMPADMAKAFKLRLSMMGKKVEMLKSKAKEGRPSKNITDAAPRSSGGGLIDLSIRGN